MAQLAGHYASGTGTICRAKLEAMPESALPAGAAVPPSGWQRRVEMRLALVGQS